MSPAMEIRGSGSSVCRQVSLFGLVVGLGACHRSWPIAATTDCAARLNSVRGKGIGYLRLTAFARMASLIARRRSGQTKVGAVVGS
jgi:hypothetical protein